MPAPVLTRTRRWPAGSMAPMDAISPDNPGTVRKESVSGSNICNPAMSLPSQSCPLSSRQTADRPSSINEVESAGSDRKDFQTPARGSKRWTPARQAVTQILPALSISMPRTRRVLTAVGAVAMKSGRIMVSRPSTYCQRPRSVPSRRSPCRSSIIPYTVRTRDSSLPGNWILSKPCFPGRHRLRVPPRPVGVRGPVPTQRDPWLSSNTDPMALSSRLRGSESSCKWTSNMELPGSYLFSPVCQDPAQMMPDRSQWMLSTGPCTGEPGLSGSWTWWTKAPVSGLN